MGDVLVLSMVICVLAVCGRRGPSDGFVWKLENPGMNWPGAIRVDPDTTPGLAGFGGVGFDPMARHQAPGPTLGTSRDDPGPLDHDRRRRLRAVRRGPDMRC